MPTFDYVMNGIPPLLLFWTVSAASAATLTVTSLADDGSSGTLRAVVASAASGDRIVFDAALAGGTIALTTDSGPIEVATTLSIVGPEGNFITIDGRGGAGGTPPFMKSGRTTSLLYASDADATLTLKNLLFTGSLADQDSAAPHIGPAVSIRGSAVIDNCCWTNNGMAQTGAYTDSTSDGGACLRVEGDAAISKCRFLESGVDGVNYSAGGLVSLRGAAVSVANCVFSGSYGWGGTTEGGNVRAGAHLGLGPAVADFTMTDCLLEKGTAGAGSGAITLAPACAGTCRFKNCVFRDLWGGGGWRNGGAFNYNGGNAIAAMFENCEFSRIRSGGWGGAVRSASPSARFVFANCSFVNCYGDGWGTAADCRGANCFVNCTAVGNVNGSSDGDVSVFFTSATTRLLNCVCAWNYKGGGATLHDCSRYGGTLAVYNSYNGGFDTAPNATDNAMAYDGTTPFFAEPFATLSAFPVWRGSQPLSTPVSSPVLSVAAETEAANPATPRVVEIDADGALNGTGWPVKHDAAWENIAYSKDGGATWSALVGDAAAATTPLAADARGVGYALENGVPIPPIGAAAPAAAVPDGAALFIYCD